MFFGVREQSTEMGIALIGGAIAAAFLNLDRIQRFSGAGFQAEMRVVVERAYATVEDVRKLARLLVLSALDLVTNAGRWGGGDPHLKHSLVSDLISIAKSMEFVDEDLASSEAKFWRLHSWDHYNLFLEALRNNEHISSKSKERLRDRRDYQSTALPSREEIQGILDIPEDRLGPEAKERLEDYLYYIAHKKLRRVGALRESG